MKRFLMKYHSKQYNQEVKLFENLETESVEVYNTSTGHELLKTIPFEQMDYMELRQDINISYKYYMDKFFYNNLNDYSYCYLDENDSDDYLQFRAIQLILNLAELV